METSKIIRIAVYTVAVYAVTIILQIYQPTTGGYFNLGESVIYVAAIIEGPIVAAIAGGVGAALADLSTGYAVFAPATLVIKFTEGYVAGWLIHRFRHKFMKYKLELAGAVGGLYTLLLIVFAYYYWSGSVSIGPSEYLGIQLPSLALNIPLMIWIIIAVLLGGLIVYVLARRMLSSWEPVALLLAGLLMVLGYFLYEYFVSNPISGRPAAEAIYEVPVNIGQAVIGAVIAVPVASWIRRAGYSESTTTT